MCRAFTNKMHILYTVGRPLSQDVFVLFSFRSLGYRLNAQLLQYQSNMSTMLYKTCRMSRRPRVYFFRSLSSLGIILTFQCRPWSLRGPNEKETPWSPFTLALKPQLGRKFSLRSYWLSFLSRSSLERSPPSPRPKWSVCSGRGLESKYGALTGVHNLGISELIEWQDRGNLHLINGFFSDYIIQFLAIGSDSNERGSVLCRGGIDPSIPLKPSRGTGSRITPLYTPLEVKIAPLCLNYCFCACKSASNAHKLLT